MALRWCLSLAAIAVAWLLFGSSAAQALGSLDYPPDGATVSGIGSIFGWNCDATHVQIEFDGASTATAAYGYQYTRTNTQGPCGRTSTGFVLPINWGDLGSGAHTLRALADGVEFASASFTVVSLGSSYLTGKAGTVTLNDFPDVGEGVVLVWQESAQNFVPQQLLSSSPSLNGTWNGANLDSRSGCTNAQNDGEHGTYAQYGITINNSNATMFISETTSSGLQCSYSGTYTQSGPQRQASGTFSCTDGRIGTWSVSDFLVTDHEMSLNVSEQLNTTETCSINAILGGSRL